MPRMFSVDDWKERLCSVVQGDPARIVLVVGAGLSWDGSVGVWGVSEILKHLQDTFGIEAKAATPSARYQEVLGRLKGGRGAGAVEKTIRHAILASAKDSAAKSAALNEVRSGAELITCRTLQDDPKAWNTPAGVTALADLIGLIESRVSSTSGWPHPCVLSTNFDGLLELALQQRGIRFKSEVVGGDEFPHALHEQVSIVHLHGYWLRSPTLHDPDALAAKRPSLEAALRDHLKGAQVFVLGYAGWNDIIFGTTSQILDRHQSDHPPEVMWAFHESEEKVRADDANPKSACGHVLASFSGPIGTAQTSFYCGVDVHRDLPEVVKALSPSVVVGSGGAGAGATDASLALVPYLAALVPVAPKAFQPEFQALLDDAKESKPVGLVAVVALCCRVLEDSPKNVELRAKLSEPAWDLITFMVRRVVDSLGGRAPRTPTAAGEILRVPAKTNVLVGLLLAKQVDPRQILSGGPRGAVSRDDLSPAIRASLFEPGPAETDRMLQFETLVWKAIFPNDPVFTLGCKGTTCVISTCASDCRKRDLYARLGADAAKGRPHFVMINPGSGTAWKDIAAKANQVVFVEPDGSATAGLEEDQLAFLISDFLKLTVKEPQ